MSEDFVPGMIWPEEAHDVAVAVAAIEVVLAVEDHVLRALDDPEADRADRAQLVVQRIGRTRIRRRRRRGRGREISRRDIDLVENLVAGFLGGHSDKKPAPEDSGTEGAGVPVRRRE